MSGATSTDDLVRALLPALERKGVKLALLFGSYARGEADEYSDVDLIIVADTRTPFIERFKEFIDVWRASPVKAMDMLVYTPDEFRQMREQENPFIATALEEGKVIYEA